MRYLLYECSFKGDIWPMLVPAPTILPPEWRVDAIPLGVFDGEADALAALRAWKPGRAGASLSAEAIAWGEDGVPRAVFPRVPD